jgi:hypothetical protein
MKQLNKILVPTDLSEKSLHALHYGCGLAAEDQAARLSPCPVLSITAPQPSKPWRGKLMPLLFGGPRQRVASV